MATDPSHGKDQLPSYQDYLSTIRENYTTCNSPPPTYTSAIQSSLETQIPARNTPTQRPVNFSRNLQGARQMKISWVWIVFAVIFCFPLGIIGAKFRHMAVLALEKGDQKNAAKYIKVTAILIVFSICFGLTTLFVSVAFSRPMREKPIQTYHYYHYYYYDYSDACDKYVKWNGLGRYVGCYNNSENILSEQPMVLEKASAHSCILHCASKGFWFSGLERSTYCQCGNKYELIGLVLDDCNCNAQCDQYSTCGGPSDIVSLFVTNYKGCFRGSLEVKMNMTDSEVTPHSCISMCSSKGYNFAGLKSPGICFCDQKLDGISRLDDNRCDFKCQADQTTVCGSSNASSVFELSREEDYFEK